MTTPKRLLLTVGLVLVAGAIVVAGAIKLMAPVAGALSPTTHLESGVWWFSNTHYFGSAQQASVSSTGAATFAGITNTTSDSATSTLVTGCVQTYATSTATPVRLELSTSTTNATYHGGSAPTGAVAWRYGICP